MVGSASAHSNYQPNGVVYQAPTPISYYDQTSSHATHYVAPSIMATHSAGEPSSMQVVRRETGQQRLVSQTSHVDESRAGSILSERLVEHEIRVPKKIVREEIVERVIVVPEKRIVEEIVEEAQMVRQKIIEIAKPTVVEKVIEIPEIQLVEKIVEVPEKIVQEKIVEQERIIEQEVIVQVPKIVERQQVVEVPVIEYVDKPYEKPVYIDDIQEVIVEKKVPVPQYVEKPVPQEKLVNTFVPYERKIPVALEAEVTYEYKLPTMIPRYTKASYPVYLPRFIEVPVATELLDQDLVNETTKYLKQADGLSKMAASCCEIEGFAATVLNADIVKRAAGRSMQDYVLKAWAQNQLNPVKAQD